MCSETDRLLGGDGSKLASEQFLRRQARKKKRRNRLIAWIGALVCASVYGTMVFYQHASDPSRAASSSLLGRARHNKAMVKIDPDTGVYSIDWDGDGMGDNAYSSVIDTDSTTFAELAKIMLLPWYEASIMALTDDPAWESEDGIQPSNAAHIRKVLLITRDMIDVFSPVFPDTPVGKQGKTKKHKTKTKAKQTEHEKDRSLWKKLRKMYRQGYQKMGELKDLEDLTYSNKLLATRVDAVTEWKKEFIAFQRKYRIRHFLYEPLSSGGGIDPNGCYYHDASHLFWADTEGSELPSGNSSGVGSLRNLGTVQLENSLGYLRLIRSYESVLSRDHEIHFHNLRKELRIFLDEYGIFGSVLVPSTNATLSTADGHDDDGGDDSPLGEAMGILNHAQSKLGHINDKWTALDIYKSDDSHKKHWGSMATKIDKLWEEFLDWEHRHDLEGEIEFVLEEMKQ